MKGVVTPKLTFGPTRPLSASGFTQDENGPSPKSRRSRWRTRCQTAWPSPPVEINPGCLLASLFVSDMTPYDPMKLLWTAPSSFARFPFAAFLFRHPEYVLALLVPSSSLTFVPREGPRPSNHQPGPGAGRGLASLQTRCQYCRRACSPQPLRQSPHYASADLNGI